MDITTFRKNLSAVLDRVEFRGERIVLAHNGKKVAAIVPIEDLEFRSAEEDRIDIVAARAALKERGRLPLNKLKSRLGLDPR